MNGVGRKIMYGLRVAFLLNIFEWFAGGAM
jgi:hypothetical protein